MTPDSIPFVICGIFCIGPILAGLIGFYVPRILAKRLPSLSTIRFNKQGRKYTVTELSLLTKEEINKMRKADK